MTTVLDTYELSPMQAGMLFHRLSGGDPHVDLQQVVGTLREPLDEANFLRAWQRVAERHPILRSRFRWEGVAQPVQDVIDRIQIPVEYFDWSALEEAERHQRFRAFLDSDRDRGFDLETAPLMRLALVRASVNEWWMVWTNHHAVLDGRSLLLVLGEIFDFYEVFLRGENIDLPLPRPYRDYIKWRRGLDHGAAKLYWKQVLEGFSTPTPLVGARDREIENLAGSDWGSHVIRLSSERTAALRGFAREASVTLNTLTQGAWALLLHRYSGELDIVFGATRACRRSALGGTDDMVGLFINTLPLRVRVDPEAELETWLQQLRAQQFGLRDYEHTSLVDVQGWSDVPRGLPLFESIVVFENRTLNEQFRALSGAWRARQFSIRGQAGLPLALNAWGDDELTLELDYFRRRFADDVGARMLDHLQVLLSGMADNHRARLKDLPLLTESERHQLLVEWNDTATDCPPDVLLHQLFEAQALRTPDSVAVVFGDQRLTYYELDEHANQLAHHLQQHGVGPDTPVAICVERSLEMVVGLLGILKAGGGYVPISPDLPLQRIAYILDEIQSPTVLTQHRFHAQLSFNHARTICLDTDWPAIAREPKSPPSNNTILSNIAYVIYTSGSTGQPKGVMITHAGICNHMFWIQRVYPLSSADVVLQNTTYTFDASLWELFAPLLIGARLVVPQPGDKLGSAELARMILSHNVSTLQVVPSQLRVLLEESAYWRCAPPLKDVYCAGEVLTKDLCDTFYTRFPEARLHNMYGPTETIIESIVWDVPHDRRPNVIPIGRPIDNTRVYIVDPRMQLSPISVPGELLIGGTQLARGYLNQGELTDEKFISDPFFAEPGARVYKTGDRARYLPDGNIEWLGRIDNQVKIRGHRVELGEIETVLAEHPTVHQVAVHLWQVKANDVRIVACCVPAKAGALAPIRLRKHLRERLPEYMIPQYFLSVDDIPLMPNGKVDRRRLPTPVVTESRIGRHEALLNQVEETIAEIWTKLIHPARPIGRFDKFFEMGGHSLLSVPALRQIEDKLGVRLDFRVLFQESLADIAARCRSEQMLKPSQDERTP